MFRHIMILRKIYLFNYVKGKCARHAYSHNIIINQWSNCFFVSMNFNIELYAMIAYWIAVMVVVVCGYTIKSINK